MSEANLEISATIHWITTSAGGRESPVWSGYRPSFLFYKNWPDHYDATVHFPTGVIGQPGSETTVKLYPHNPQWWDFAQPGNQFAVMEGARIVGVGEVQSREIGTWSLKNDSDPQT